MEQQDIRLGTIVQVTKDGHQYYGDFIVVTEPKTWGVQGYICSPFQQPGLVRYKGIAYVRVQKEDFTIVGSTDLVINEKQEDKDD